MGTGMSVRIVCPAIIAWQTHHLTDIVTTWEVGE